MPKPPAHLLCWSAKNHSYILRASDYSPQSIQPGNEAVWQAWLKTHSSFSFQGQHGHLNVFKERRASGTGYWYAYHTSSGSRRKRYLGASATVTLARLEEIAQDLHLGQHPWQGSASPLTVPTTFVGNQISSRIVEPGDAFTDPNMMMIMTKLSPPPLPATLVVRERLLSALDSALFRPLTLLSASAGWGKTTLLSAWAQRQQEPVAWLSLEALDNDPTRFWISLITALRSCRPQIGGRALALLQKPSHVSESLSLSVTALINDLSDQQKETSPLLLILDDYHVIEEPTIHASLLFWLKHLPSYVHLILSSRVNPEFPLSRFRAHGHLGEIRDTDLRFTAEETHHFLTRSMGLLLSESDIELLEVRTEGWIASLQLAALFLRKQTDLSAGVQMLRGSQRFILDYLREEILASLSEEVQVFLLQTSGLNRLSASLCDAITDREDSDRLLEQMERANLFLQPLDERRQWYRYHALWAQAMQHEALHRLGAATMHSLSSKASRWYEQQRLLPEAIEAALAGEDFGHVVALIEHFVVPQSFGNAYHTLARWLRQLPEEIVRAQPDLCLLSALALTFTTDRRSPATWEQVERLLQWAKQGFEATQQWEQLGEALQLHAELAFFQDDLASTLTLARQAQPLLSEQSLIYPENVLIHGLEAFLAGETEVASQHLLEGYRRVKHLRNHPATFAASLLLGEVCREKSELRKASQYYHRALAHIDEDQETFRQQLLLETGDTEPFFISWAYHCLAQLFYERNEMAKAQHTLSQALALREKPEAGVHALASGSLIQARLLHAGGETAQAQDVLAKWERHTRFPWSVRVIRACRARLHLIDGDLSAVELWAQETHQADHSQASEREHELPLMLQQEEALLLARLHITQQRGETALNELAPWKEKAQAQGRKRSVLEILILEALAHLACRSRSQARSSLLQALQLAQPENYQRLFLDEGSAMERLLKTLLPELHEASLISYVRTLLRAFALRPDARSTEEAAPPRKKLLPLEPLSDQEQRVLRLLVVGRSNPEIARELEISVNTVKTHVQSLYRKLGVRNRTEAGEVARRWSLLSSF